MNPLSDRRLHGRQKGHPLSPRRAALMADRLPALRIRQDRPCPGDLRELFSNPVRDVWLEIGFGAGEHLVAQAAANPDIGFIGCEPFLNGVARLVSEIEAHGLQNIRIHDDDARLLAERLPDCSIGRCFILFPDPWPKKRHAKRRLVAPAFVRELARVIGPNAELRFATDIADYVRTGLLAVLTNGAFNWPATGPGHWRYRPPDWPATRYEAKAERDGRRCYYFRFEKAGNR